MATKNNKKNRIHTIVTHFKPHLDEIVAIWLCRKYSSKMWAPGADKAEVILWGHGQARPDERTAEELERDGHVLIGVCGGMFDEHPKREGECAATLMAKYLKVDRYTELKNILKFTLRTDLKGDQPFGLADMVRTLNESHPDNPEYVIEWACYALDAEFAQQRKFKDAIKEYREATIMVVEVGGKDRQIGLIQSDNPMIGRASRFNKHCLLIQKNSGGNVGIHTDRHSRISLRNVADRLMKQEPDRWYYHEEAESLLNGSLTAKDVPATQLPLEEIGGCVVSNL
jgi:hypothetical protein